MDAPVQSITQPIFWIIGGPNGSGKSTSYEQTEIQTSSGSIWIINPDILTLRISKQELAPEANLESVKRIEAWIEASIRTYQTVGVETVLSTEKYRRLVLLSQSFGFRFHFTYVYLESPELCLERVRLRVKKGGHSVPKDKIFARYKRSLNQLPWFLEAADFATIFDNSGSTLKRIVEKRDGIFTVDDNAPLIMKQVVERIG